MDRYHFETQDTFEVDYTSLNNIQKPERIIVRGRRVVGAVTSALESYYPSQRLLETKVHITNPRTIDELKRSGTFLEHYIQIRHEL